MADTLVPIKQYIDTAANLTAANPTPLLRQIIYESDTGKKKIGDGTTAYNSLAYAVEPTKHHTIGVTVDGGGSVVTTGNKGARQVNFTGTLVGVTLLANTTGSVEFEILKNTYASYPSASSSIVGTNKPAIVSSQKASITLDGGWTTSVSAGDVLRFAITGTPATITQVSIFLHYDE